MLMYVKKEENFDWEKEEPTAFDNLMRGYEECMPGINASALHWRYLQNEHMANQKFGEEPKYFMAIDKSHLGDKGIVAISALYVFPEYRRQGFAKLLLEQAKILATNGIVLQVAVNFDKYEELKSFYEKMGFKTTGKVNKSDMFGLKYIDLFWCALPFSMEHDENIGTIIGRGQGK